MASRTPGARSADDLPLVSIVVVAYNNWPDLELAIQSALCQSYRPLEVIVVDNSSTDATPKEVAKRFGGRVRYIRQSNTGDAGAYNNGFRLAEGDFIQFLDGDDLLTPYKIEKQMEVFRAEPSVDIVYGDIRWFQTLPARARWRDFATRDYDDMVAATLAPEPHGVETILSVLLRRRALERVGPWDETVYCTDFDYWLRAAWLGCRFRRCPGLMGFARIHPKQMSADAAAMRCGTEAVLLKALTYIDRELYRAMIVNNLARLQLFMAVAGTGMTRREALAKWRQSRRTDPGAVPAPARLAALGAILAPGGRFAACSPQFRSLRRSIARLTGYQIPRF